MIYGYTVADHADRDVFDTANDFIINVLRFVPIGTLLEDVDGSILQKYARGTERLILESVLDIDYVGIKSSVPLPVKCLVKWESKCDTI